MGGAGGGSGAARRDQESVDISGGSAAAGFQGSDLHQSFLQRTPTPPTPTLQRPALFNPASSIKRRSAASRSEHLKFRAKQNNNNAL